MKLKRIIPLLLAWIIPVGMVGCSELLHDSEIIFPEILALCAGALAAKSMPWRVSRTKMLVLMSLSAVAGVCIVRYLPVPKAVQLICAFAFSALSLIISRTTMFPMISACVLPVMLGTESIIYIAAVVILTVLIILSNILLEKSGISAAPHYTPCEIGSESILLWLKRSAFFAAAAVICCISNQLYFIAPPLIVAFSELSESGSPARKIPIKLIAVVSFAAVAGYFTRAVLFGILHLPLTACAAIVSASMLAVFFFSKTYFPPAGAISLLPLILPAVSLWRYPIEVIIGMSLLTLISLKLFGQEKTASLSTNENGATAQINGENPAE